MPKPRKRVTRGDQRKRLREKFQRRTKRITVEHRNSWGDELRCNMNQRLLSEATTSRRSWLVVITIWFEAPSGKYFDEYKMRFDSCTLTDSKSTKKFDDLRDLFQKEGNTKQIVDWGWFATPWSPEVKKKYFLPDDQLFTATIEEPTDDRISTVLHDSGMDSDLLAIRELLSVLP